MKIVPTQSPPPSKSACFSPSRFTFSAITLAVTGTFLTLGCGDRRPSVKPSDSSPPPVTTAPVLSQPTPVSTTPTATESEKRNEEHVPTGRAPDDEQPVIEPNATPRDRNDDDQASSPPAKRDGVAPSSIPSSDDTRTQPASTVADEEDVSAALRREVAEVERRRTQQQPRGW
jgi:hypothetical protein